MGKIGIKVVTDTQEIDELIIEKKMWTGENILARKELRVIILFRG